MQADMEQFAALYGVVDPWSVFDNYNDEAEEQLALYEEGALAEYHHMLFGRLDPCYAHEEALRLRYEPVAEFDDDWDEYWYIHRLHRRYVPKQEDIRP